VSERALLTVVRGLPTDEELAAVVALVTARSAASAPAAAAAPRSLWGAPASAVRRPLPSGPGAWRASSLPS